MNYIWTILNNSCSCRFNNVYTSPVSFPRIPDNRTKTGLWINSSICRKIIECLSIIAFSINNFCFKSGCIYPVICGRSKFKCSIPETNQEWSYTFSSCSKRLFNKFYFRIIKSYNIIRFSYIISFNRCKIKILICVSVNNWTKY